MSHTDSGVPGLEFSHAITLTTGLHGSAAAATDELIGRSTIVAARTLRVATAPERKRPNIFTSLRSVCTNEQRRSG